MLAALRQGSIREQGLLPYSSNHSFLIVVDGNIDDEQLSLPAVYKPQRGENPLWDFEWGTLCKRETAAYQVSSALEWDLVAIEGNASLAGTIEIERLSALTPGQEFTVLTTTGSTTG